MSCRDNKHWVSKCNRKGKGLDPYKDLTGQLYNDNRKILITSGERKLNSRHTSADCRTTLAKIRKAMTRELEMALLAREKMEPWAVDAAAQLISDLGAVKRKIEDRAESLGYSKRCREAIAVCGGECCRWHFPKTINRADFFIAVFYLDADAAAVLMELVQAAEDGSYQCPLLCKDGCIFTFESRPVACTSAFPCLAGADYWRYKERFREAIGAIRAELSSLIDKSASGRR